MSPHHGTWRSSVAHLLWEQGVESSNLSVPTTQKACLCGPFGRFEHVRVSLEWDRRRNDTNDVVPIRANQPIHGTSTCAGLNNESLAGGQGPPNATTSSGGGRQ